MKCSTATTATTFLILPRLASETLNNRPHLQSPCSGCTRAAAFIHEQAGMLPGVRRSLGLSTAAGPFKSRSDIVWLAGLKIQGRNGKDDWRDVVTASPPVILHLQALVRPQLQGHLVGRAGGAMPRSNPGGGESNPGRPRRVAKAVSDRGRATAALCRSYWQGRSLARPHELISRSGAGRRPRSRRPV